MATEAKETKGEQGMSKEDKALLMKALWKALQAPQWTKDDLIAFGKAIFSRHSLKEMPDKVFEAIYPFLASITEALGEQLAKEADAASAKPKPNGKVDNKEEKTAVDEDEDDDGEESAEAAK